MLSGLIAGWFVIGEDLKHSIYAIAGTYLILVGAGGTLLSVIISFIFNFGYLLVGYYFTESEGYDICWTMPHCVLTLRLIGLTFDLYDGERARRLGRQALSKDQEETALEEAPSMLEIFSHSFFLGGYFVGPQIAMKKYKQFVSPTYQASLPGSPLSYGLKRLGLGFLYMLFHVVGSLWLPNDWPASQHFSSIPLVVRLLLLTVWCKGVLAKYLSAWLLAEGVCIFSGLAYSGQRKDGSPDWSGCANIKVRRLESARKLGHVIETFNINTNHWVAVYIYKRLKFLGSRTVSQVITLIFLAVWHGFHSGYYLTFINEFLVVKLEREFLSIWGRSKKAERWMENPSLVRLFNILGWLWCLFFLPFCFLAFPLLTFSKYYQAYSATYFLLYIVFGSWSLMKGFVKKFLFDENTETKARHEEARNVHVDENIPEEVPKNIPENVPEEVAEKVAENVPENVPDQEEEEKADKKNV